MTKEKTPNKPSRWGHYWKFLVFLLLATAAGLMYSKFGAQISFSNLAEREQDIRQYFGEHPIRVYAGAFVLYVVVTGLSLPGATVLSLAYGWFFGLLRGCVLVSFASTAGAIVAFLTSRFLLRDYLVKKLGHRLQAFNENLEKDGGFYLFSLRLIPVVPFFVINIGMGLTPMKLKTFWWVSQLGMLPGTIVYIYAGANVPSLDTFSEQGVRGILTPQLVLAFGLLGLFPVIARKSLRYLRPSRQQND